MWVPPVEIVFCWVGRISRGRFLLHTGVMSDLARVAVNGKELAIPVKANSANDATVPRPNTPADPAVDVNGQEAAKGGQGGQDV